MPPTPPPPRLLIVTVNYRTAELCIGCMRSAVAEMANWPDAKMVVVDNDSGDGSLERMRAAVAENNWSGSISVVPAGRNGGFAFGNNVAIGPALRGSHPPDLIWLLNPDAELLTGAAQALLAFLQAHPKAGIVTGRWVPLGGQQAEAPTAFRAFSMISEFCSMVHLNMLTKLFPQAEIRIRPRDEPYPADWLSGTALMIRREVFEDVGLMDEGYFLYYEESDFCLQAKRKGWELWFVPDSRFHHVIGASTGFTPNQSRQPRRPAYWFHSRRRYFLKNFGSAYALFADLMHMAGYLVWRLRSLVERKPNLEPPHYLRDFLSHSVWSIGFKL